MDDRYHHIMPNRLSAAGTENLLKLARYLVANAERLDAGQSLAFGADAITDIPFCPGDVAGLARIALPPLAHGPLAGIPAEPDEDWPGYCARVFGIAGDPPLIRWLQSPLWRKTDPGAVGAGLRIAYVLQYGVPYDHVEIAMGQAWSDYDSNGFLWDRLNMAPVDIDDARIGSRRHRPEWIGTVSRDERLSRVLLHAGNLLPTLSANGIAAPYETEGCTPGEIAALERRFGAMPRSYGDVLSLIGHRAGRLVDRRELWIFADHLEKVNRLARERIFDGEEPEDDPVPGDAIFIGARYGEHPWFILPGERADSPVFHFNGDTGEVTEVGMSVWSWVEGLVRDMRPDIRIATRGDRPAPLPRPDTTAANASLARAPLEAGNRRHGARVAVYTMLVGGALLIAALLAWRLWRVMAP